MKAGLSGLVLAAALAAISAGLCLADMRVSSEDAMKAATTKVAPVYPPLAKQMKVSGHVEVEVNIKEDGSVADAKAVTGNALLTGAAVNAAKRWKFTPFTQNGAATAAVAVIGFDFTL